MKRKIICLSLLSVLLLMPAEEKKMNIYEFTLDDIRGNPRALSDFAGKVVLIVNTASKCGFTHQYDGLEELYQTYKERGFVILGFPANNFLKQEPGSNEQIAEFCRINYGVTFPMFRKISVRGKEMHPLYRFLSSKDSNPEFGGKITWNFNKFLISREGKIINRFESKTEPLHTEIIKAIEQALN